MVEIKMEWHRWFVSATGDWCIKGMAVMEWRGEH
jgi:hypothetical protein